MSDVPNRAPEDDAPLEGGPDKTESGVQPVATPAPMPRRKRSQIFAAEPKARRRRHSRIDVQLPVEVLVDGVDDVQKSRCANLSLGGMFILLTPGPPHGTKLRVWLSLPTGDRLMVTGTIRWSTRDGVGIQHELLGARDTFILTQYLASLKATPEV
ncbi:MAG: PilZ domain-containing protein [Polyangiaceae bacterium]